MGINEVRSAGARVVMAPPQEQKSGRVRKSKHDVLLASMAHGAALVCELVRVRLLFACVFTLRNVDRSLGGMPRMATNTAERRWGRIRKLALYGLRERHTRTLPSTPTRTSPTTTW